MEASTLTSQYWLSLSSARTSPNACVLDILRCKAKAHLELNVAKDVRDKKNVFLLLLMYLEKPKNNVGLLLKGRGTLVTEDAEKAVSEQPLCISLH